MIPEYRLLACVMVVVASATATIAQSDRVRVESQARRASERLAALQREAQSLAAQERSLLVDLRRLEVERDLRTEQLKQLGADTDTVARELVNLGNQIDALQERETATRPALEARMTELYKLGSGGYVRMLFNVSDLKEFGRAYRMVSALAAIDRQRAAEHKHNLTRLRTAQSSAEQQRTALAKLQREALAARSAAERAAGARAALIAQIDARRDLTAELAGELQAAQQRLQQTLGTINSSQARAAPDAAALPLRPFRGDLDWPVAGRILSGFGRGRSRGVAAGMSNGIQFSAQEGAVVRAVHDGNVVFTGPFTGFGNLVIVEHGREAYSLYGQLETIRVERGASVERGREIGTVGRVLAGVTGMYFEMRVDGKPVNPLEWLRKRP